MYWKYLKYLNAYPSRRTMFLNQIVMMAMYEQLPIKIPMKI